MTNTLVKKESHYDKVISESMALLLDYNLTKIANSGGTIDDLVEYFNYTSEKDIVEEYFNNGFIELNESCNENYNFLLEDLEYICENRGAAAMNALKWLFKVGIGGSRGGPNIFQRGANSLKNLFRRIKNSKKGKGPQKVNIPPPNRPPGGTGNRNRSPGGSRNRTGTPASRRQQRAAQRQQRTDSARNRSSRDTRDGLRKRDLAKIALGAGTLGAVIWGANELKNKGAAPGGAGPEETPPSYNPPPLRPGIDTPGSSSAPSGGSSVAQQPRQPRQPEKPSGGSQGAPRTPKVEPGPLPASLPQSPSSGKSKELQQWEKANKILSIAAAERERIRGTSQTDNPLMKDLLSRLPEPTKEYQAPEVSTLGKGHQSLKDNPNAKKKKAMSEQLQVTKNEAYLIVSDYLITNGHADSIEESFYIAAGMDVNTVMDIVESYYEAYSLMESEGA